MKELSIEQKAQRYDKALEIARKINSGEGVAAPSGWTTCEVIFPELRKSEDEKIRKALIDGFTVMKESKNCGKTFSNHNIPVVDILAWLEKQGKYAENKEFLASEKRDFGYFNETTDKLEPKFHEGEWIISDTVNKDYHICKITGIKDGNYTIESIYGYKGYNQFDVFDNVYRLWTIQDANPGDVLAVEPFIEGHIYPFIAIFESRGLDYFRSYCFMAFDGNFFEGNTGHSIANVHPATKEQSNQLEKAMTDAGYTFDFEKKKLNKIEPKPVEWSEEDEYYRNIILYILNNECVGKTDKENAINWLKSLKSHNEC